jgi:hypothetical protein
MTPIDTSKIICSQYWHIIDDKWFGDDTIVLESIAKWRLKRKPTKRRHKKYYDYFYFDSSNQVKYSKYYPGFCSVGLPSRTLTGFRRNANLIKVDFSNYFHQVKPKGPFKDYDGPMVYEIIELNNHKILLVKRKA